MQVLIIDKSILIIERLEELISGAENISAIHRAISYVEAKNLFNEYRHEMVFLNVDLPGNESLKLLKEIKEIEEKTCVIILYSHIDNYIMEQCKSLGVIYFLDKYYDFEKIPELLSAIQNERQF